MSQYTVLGASGFVGSRLVATLRGAGIDCYAPGRDDRDILQRDLGRVFYCIGLTADYARRPFDTVRAHVGYLAELLEHARFERLIYLSSTRLYDSLPRVTGEEAADLVFAPTNPRHLYDLSKALGENLCLTASQGRASVARLSCVYDAAENSPGFLSELLQRLRTGRTFELDSSSGFARDYVALDDVVAALRAILDGGRQEICNVASGENVSNAEMAAALNVLGCKVTFTRSSEKQSAAICDVSRINALGVTPVLVRDYLQSYLARLERHEAR